MATLPDLLHPVFINERVSRLRVVNTTLQTAFGMTPGGANVRQTPSRRGSYDVFNDTRDVPTAVTPGSHAATIARQPVGNVPFNIPRTAEKLPLPLEELHQARPIGGPANVIDSLGEQYIFEQERVTKQRYTNLREFQVAAMLRGSYTYTAQNDSFVHDFTGGTYTVDYQIPSGSKSQLDMLGGGDIIGTAWDNSASPIVRDLLAVNSAFNQLNGMGLTDIWCTSVVWGFVITNTEVQSLAGSVNNPVQSFTRDEERQEFTGTLNGAPWVTWHITDNGLNVNGSFTKLIADTAATFTTRIDSRVANYWECSEPVVDPVSQAVSAQYGEYYYTKFTDDPPAYEFHSRFNGLPVLFIPNSIAYGTVDF